MTSREFECSVGVRRSGCAAGGAWQGLILGRPPLRVARSGFAGPWRARALAVPLAAPEGSAQTLPASQWFKQASLPQVARSAHARAVQPPHKSALPGTTCRVPTSRLIDALSTARRPDFRSAGIASVTRRTGTRTAGPAHPEELASELNGGARINRRPGLRIKSAMTAPL